MESLRLYLIIFKILSRRIVNKYHISMHYWTLKSHFYWVWKFVLSVIISVHSFVFSSIVRAMINSIRNCTPCSNSLWTKVIKLKGGNIFIFSCLLAYALLNVRISFYIFSIKSLWCICFWACKTSSIIFYISLCNWRIYNLFESLDSRKVVFECSKMLSHRHI